MTITIPPRSVHAYIIGEHGDSEVPVWSLANIARMHLPLYCNNNGLNCDPDVLEHIFEQTRDAAYQIIERKGATYSIGIKLIHRYTWKGWLNQHLACLMQPSAEFHCLQDNPR
ncbi:MAG: hypothetical protein K8R77_15295 [Anaerolineaceae bacterium]|nr:hypothetical protein [Anaerolineaceae bacterium]